MKAIGKKARASARRTLRALKALATICLAGICLTSTAQVLASFRGPPQTNAFIINIQQGSLPVGNWTNAAQVPYPIIINSTDATLTNVHATWGGTVENGSRVGGGLQMNGSLYRFTNGAVYVTQATGNAGSYSATSIAYNWNGELIFRPYIVNTNPPPMQETP